MVKFYSNRDKITVTTLYCLSDHYWFLQIGKYEIKIIVMPGKELFLETKSQPF